MVEINVKAARSHFSELLNLVEEGDEVVILRHGKAIAKLVSPKEKKRSLPSLKEFRGSIQVKGKSLSKTVIRNREEERY